MTQLAQRLSFNLPDTLAGDGKGLSDFFKRMLGAVLESEAHLDDLLFARCERAENVRRLFLQVHVDHSLGRRDDAAVFDEVAQMRIFLFSNWSFERDRLL